jgi:hypothetical protein
VIFENLFGGDVTVYLYNSAGAETTSFTLIDKYRVHSLNAGIYYYRIIGKDGAQYSGKLIVTK